MNSLWNHSWLVIKRGRWCLWRCQRLLFC